MRTNEIKREGFVLDVLRGEIEKFAEEGRILRRIKTYNFLPNSVVGVDKQMEVNDARSNSSVYQVTRFIVAPPVKMWDPKSLNEITRRLTERV